MNARTEPDLTVRKTVTVMAPQAVAFEVFTARMATWWRWPATRSGPPTAPSDRRAARRRPWFERGHGRRRVPWGDGARWSRTRGVSSHGG